MSDQAYNLKEIAKMNDEPLQQHVLTLLLKDKRSVSETALYLTQAAVLIPQLLEIDQNRPIHQKLIRLLEELPTLHPSTQMSSMMGLHPSSTEDDIAEMTDEMMSLTELDELTLLIADNLMGVLNRE